MVFKDLDSTFKVILAIFTELAPDCLVEILKVACFFIITNCSLHFFLDFLFIFLSFN